MVVVPEKYEKKQVCATCHNSIDDEEVSVVHQRKWYHSSCWLKDKSIKTKPRDINSEELEVY